MESITCINCGQEFESDNEDDMVLRLCPDCLDGTGENPELDSDY